MGKPGFSLFDRFVEASPASRRGGPATELFAFVHGRRAQAPTTFDATGAFPVWTFQWVDIQIGVVDAIATAAIAATTDGGILSDVFEDRVMQVVGREVTL